LQGEEEAISSGAVRRPGGDHFREKLSLDPNAGQRGWLKDKYGFAAKLSPPPGANSFERRPKADGARGQGLFQEEAVRAELR
jgi:hypothetical protein